MNRKVFWSIYAPYIKDFVDLKRSLGYKYKEGERILFLFDKFIIEQGETAIGFSKELADKWSVRTNNESDLTRYGKVVCINQFSDYLRGLGVKSYIPQLPKYPGTDFIPHIFTYIEMNALFNASDNLRLRLKDMGSSMFVMPCLLRMLYATGIRIGEALSLKNKDINLTDKYLILRETKNQKERIVPFTDSFANVCQDYLEQRNKLPIIGIDKDDNPFFVTLNGCCCRHSAIYNWFRKTLDRAGIPLEGNRHGPRVHDIRHSFACHSFVKLSDEGMDLYCSWPYLSTYLGHQSLESTEQYVRLTAQMYPDLLKDADRILIDVLPDSNQNVQNMKP
ncbi:MAG: tyrosine-type recombinase/integrase [Bacteroidales bacterium]|jgi:integrase|nr:tyrosine-type recombinase/integrase [Bacteroidales bacterium]